MTVRTRTISFVAVAALLLAVAVPTLVRVLTSPDERHDLMVYNPQHNSGTSIQYDVKVGEPYAFIMPNLCTASGKPLTVTGVDPVSPYGGVRVVDWAIESYRAADRPDGFPCKAVGIPGFVTGSTPVTDRCGPNGTTGFALGLLVTSTHGGAKGWTVHSTGGDTYVPLGVKLDHRSPPQP